VTAVPSVDCFIGYNDARRSLLGGIIISHVVMRIQNGISPFRNRDVVYGILTLREILGDLRLGFSGYEEFPLFR
jgi:hypothetical protein